MLTPHDHILLESEPESLRYTSTQQGGSNFRIPTRNRNEHSAKLLKKFDEIWQAETTLKEERTAISLSIRKGTYLEFASSTDSDLITKSLEDLRQNIRLLNVREESSVEDGGKINKAAVFIPEGKETVFLKKIQDYSDSSKDTAETSRPKNANLVNSINDIELAIVESLWTDDTRLLPEKTRRWCEVWIRIDEDRSFDSQITDFTTILEQNEIDYKGNALHFPERAVLLINANRQILTELLYSTDQLAEFRIGQEAAGFWYDDNNTGQSEWVRDLLSRIEIQDSNVKVCILDSGINNGHPLLNPIVSDDNCLTINPNWDTDDSSQIAGPKGHGTMMAGIVGFGNLQEALETNDLVFLTHKICSVKILPRVGQSVPQHWGDFTEQAIYRAETENSEETLLFCMAVTSNTDIDRGKPSSWSGVVDYLCYGERNNKRLFIVSGGNVTDPEIWKEYPNQNRLFSIQNPAQSWNALTIGAYTKKVFVDDEDYIDYSPIAPSRGISPYNSTSSLWQNKWPIKPDVVFEGGNILRTQEEEDEIDFCQHQDLETLTTSKNLQIRQFDTFNGTSSATAEASWLAAKIAYKYPNLWPESIRALIVHSASWSSEMIGQFNTDLSRKGSVLELMRICGYGVPDFQRSLNSFENGLTLIAQEEIQPFVKESGAYKTNEMQLFDFPWPKDELLSLGDTPVKLKITLSYYIEPGPGQIGWKDKYRYQSYGLRFDVNREGESKEEFEQRINKAARDEEYDSTGGSPDNRWTIGKDNRSIGSIHSDIWEDTAANIADCNLIAVYPVIGWWRERRNLKRFNSVTRYSLLVSLETPSEDIELYTAITNKIATTVGIEIPT